MAIAVTDSLEAFFIVLIKLYSSSPSKSQAKFPFEKNKNSFFPLLAITEADLYWWPLVTLISFLIFSEFLNVTNNLEGSLFKFLGSLSSGMVCAKQTFPFASL